MKINRLLALIGIQILTFNIAASENVVIAGNASAVPDSTVVIFSHFEG